ncbi:IclR family transcriptional regulator [Nocardia sp. NPDC019395]|uniref:IclR family transcriptional regulator n=1 Tax=Nocardia sp. NPDC019395 TaxID=3154686 RepID=UPI0033DD36DE
MATDDASNGENGNKNNGQKQDNSAAGTVKRTVRMLAALADLGGEAGVGKIADHMTLPASTVHRLLKILTEEGVVVRDPDTHNYSIGAELYRISSRVTAQVDITAIVRPYLEDVANAFDETVIFGIYMPANKALSFTARADGAQLLRYRIELHRPLSLVWGASGKAVLAQLDSATVADVLEHERGLAGGGRAPGSAAELPTLDELERDLQAVRAAGYAISEGEKLPQARGIGTPVFDARGVVGSITLTSPKDRLPHGEISTIAAALIDAARSISRDLGSTAANFSPGVVSP